MRPCVYPKPCPGCGRVLPSEMYGLRRAGGVARRPRCNDCRNVEKKVRRKRDPEKTRAEYRKGYYSRKGVHPDFNRQVGLRKYGLTIEAYDALLAEQKGCCALCHTDDPKGKHGRFQVDHCHATGVIRGLLCNRCNTALGLLKDDPLVLLRAAEYVMLEGAIW